MLAGNESMLLTSGHFHGKGKLFSSLWSKNKLTSPLAPSIHMGKYCSELWDRFRILSEVHCQVAET